MKKIFVQLLILCGLFTAAHAQDAQKIRIMTVDVAELYTKYYKTIEAEKRFRTSQDNTKMEVEKIQKEGESLLAEYNQIAEEATNSALSQEKREEAQRKSQEKGQEIRKKQAEMQQFLKNSHQALQQSKNTFRSVVLDEIRDEVTNAAKARKATLVFDSSGLTNSGLPTVLYADPAWDATEAVLVALNKDAPPAE